MRIEGAKRNGPVVRRGGVSRQGGGTASFRLDASQSASAPVNTQDLSDVAGVDALLALQGVEDPVFAKRKAVKRGHTLLDELDELKADLVAGQVSEGRLGRILALVSQARDRVDPRLDQLIDDIELRARVELAKLGRYTDR